MKIGILCLSVSFLFPSTLAMAQSVPLSLQSIQPSAVPAGSGATSVTLTGSGFTSSVTVVLSDQRTLQTLTPVFVDSTTLQLTIPASFLTTPAALVLRAVNGPSASETQFLYVYSWAAPTVTSINPAGGLPGTTTTVTLTGTNLIGATATFANGAITAVTDPKDNLSPPTKWTLQITIPADAALETHAITISTPSGSTTTCGARPCTFSIVQSGTWTDASTASLPIPSAVIRLLDGRVLVVGVNTSPNGYISVAQIFDPGTNQWTGIGAPNTPRKLPNTAGVLLPDGRVFVSGSDSLMAEIYDPAAAAWSYTNPMTEAAGGSAILLPSGKVLVQQAVASSGADLFDPVSGVFQSIPAPSGTMQLLTDGKVLLLADGNDKLYDPATGAISAVPSVQPPFPTNTGYISRLLPDGRVLIQAGQRYQIHDALLVSSFAVIYDARTNTLLPSTITIGGGSPFHGAVVLPSGNVLVSEVLPIAVGPVTYLSSATAVSYDPKTDQIFPQTSANHPFTPDVLLDDGRTFGISNLNGTEFHAIFAGLYTPAPYTTTPPVIGSVLSINGVAGGPTAIEVRGTSFLPNSIVQLGQSRLVTLYLGAQHLVAFVPPALGSSLNLGITVTNPGSSGGGTASAPVGFVRTLPIADVETGTIRTGYAIITPDSGTPAPTSTLTYGIVQNAIVQSLASILPTPLTADTSLLVDFVQTIGRNLGVAIANPNNSSVTVTLTLRDSKGVPAASPVLLSIGAGNQIARFVSELFPAGTLGAAFTGSLSIQSSVPISITGLRFSGQEFSTVPVPSAGTATVPQHGAVGGPNALIFPQFAMSGGWATIFGLVNPTGNVISGRLDLFDPAGNPLVVTLNDVTASTFAYSIPAHGSFTLAPRDPTGQSPF